MLPQPSRGRLPSDIWVGASSRLVCLTKSDFGVTRVATPQQASDSATPRVYKVDLATEGLLLL